MKTPRSRFLILLSVWGFAATTAGALHLLRYVPPGVVPLLLASMTIGFTVAIARIGWMNEAMRSIGVRAILGWHVTRFLGASFLWLHAQGRIPAEFACRAGWGDIVAAAGALILVLGPSSWRRGWAFVTWNIIGVVDLFVAVGTAGWLNLARPGSMIEMSTLPFTLVPLWLVPMLIASHFTMLRWTLRGNSRETMPVNGSALLN